MSAGWIALYLLGGILTLVVGGDLLVRGAARLAAAMGLSALVVGLTVVAFGTSAPELAVSLQAAFAGEPDMTLGNVVGSNIINVLVVVGFSALLAPLMVHWTVIRNDLPMMIAASVMLILMSLDGVIGRWDGVLLMMTLLVYTMVRVWRSRSPARRGVAMSRLDEPVGRVRRAWMLHGSLVLGGLLLLIIGAHWVVLGAVALATRVGISTLVVGLTVVALGTSLPEITISLIAVLRGERDLAVGNAVGSNIFNILLILGASAMLASGGIPVARSVLTFDFPVMLAVAVVCLPIFVTKGGVSRGEGALFILYYAIYTVYLLLRAAEHDALRGIDSVMVWFVLPLCALSLIGLFVRAWWWRRTEERA